MGSSGGKGGKPPYLFVLNSQRFSLAFPLHRTPKEQFVMVSGPSGWSLSVSVTEMLGYGLISLLLTPFFEAESWKPGSFPSSLCPNAAPPSVAVQRQVQPTDTWPLSMAPAADDLPHWLCSSQIQALCYQPGGTGSERCMPAWEGTSPRLPQVVSESSSVTDKRDTCLVPPRWGF